jgi:aminoglycoside phosphotransferase (APT) family kinase protein
VRIGVERADSPPRRYLLQRINHNVFRDIPALMQNVQLVIAEQDRVLRDDPDRPLRALTLHLTAYGEGFHRDDAGGFWRLYEFVPGVDPSAAGLSTTTVETAARAFGEFAAQLHGLDSTLLSETIPAFHDTPARLERLSAAAQEDRCGRLAHVSSEIDLLHRYTPLASNLVRASSAGVLPKRITHNDTKLNNVLVSPSRAVGRGSATCVIDLDTVMPGILPHDFGELVRTSTSGAAEDERDLDAIGLDLDLYRAAARGFLAATVNVLTEAEGCHLVDGGLAMTLENASRFLTDYLEGDVYFRTHYPGHNLDRCRAQLRLLERMKERETELREIVDAERIKAACNNQSVQSPV